MMTYSMEEGIIVQSRRGQPRRVTMDPEETTPTPQELFQQSSLNEGDKLLLIFMFAHDEEIRMLIMHPEVIGVDVVAGVSHKKRDWLTVAALDGNNKAFQACRAVIPSQQRWVYTKLNNKEAEKEFMQCLRDFELMQIAKNAKDDPILNSDRERSIMAMVPRSDHKGKSSSQRIKRSAEGRSKRVAMSNKKKKKKDTTQDDIVDRVL